MAEAEDRDGERLRARGGMVAVSYLPVHAIRGVKEQGGRCLAELPQRDEVVL